MDRLDAQRQTPKRQSKLRKPSKVFLVYESELVKPDPTGKRKHGALNEARIRELAKQSRREGYRTISTDIESWFAEKNLGLLLNLHLQFDFSHLQIVFQHHHELIKHLYL